MAKDVEVYTEIWSFAMTPDMKEALEKAAREGHRTMASQVRMIVEHWLDDNG